MSTKYALFRNIIIIGSCIVSFGLFQSIWMHQRKWVLVDNRTQVLKQEQARNAQLTQKLQEATSSAFIEKEARERLGLAKSEDVIVLMVTPESSASGSPMENDLTNLEHWWRLFF